jgi:small subunit ribosomal protein S13
MARIAGIDIPINKRVVIALTYVYGIGPEVSKTILKETGVDESTRVKNLSEAEVAAINKYIRDKELAVEGELKRIVNQNIRRYIDIKSYRGSRHSSGLPVRGQRTKSNSRTRKGKKKTVGGIKKKGAKK